MKQTLKIIHKDAKIRLENKGQCTSCKYYVSPKDYFDIADCSNNLLEKLPEPTGKKSWGEKGCPCLLWEPRNFQWCDKHGFFLEDSGCNECEFEFYKLVEES